MEQAHYLACDAGKPQEAPPNTATGTLKTIRSRAGCSLPELLTGNELFFYETVLIFINDALFRYHKGINCQEFPVDDSYKISTF